MQVKGNVADIFKRNGVFMKAKHTMFISLYLISFCCVVAPYAYCASDNLPAVPLDSKKAYFNLLRVDLEKSEIPREASRDVRAKYWVDLHKKQYEKAGYSFEKTIIIYARKYKADPHFHKQPQYTNTAGRFVWGSVNFYTMDGRRGLEELPYKKYFSKEAYRALEVVAETNDKLEGKKIQ